MAHADGTKAVDFESAFDPRNGSVSVRVVEAVSTFYEVETTDLDPLYSVIEPDALDALFASSRTDRSQKGEITFQYENVVVSVDADGTIRLSDLE
ncbi:HalOD1 output domain-containing protein [Halorubrum sp. N11]|uniref:HalOD1 output domain-containing protein n=1 Tax=Halorubrum sp. N11 TaxID=3402276 RepID=UPI003EB70B3B